MRFLNLLTYISLIFICIACITNSTPIKSPVSDEYNRHMLANGMVIDVLLPPDYDSSKLYPVLLLNDGEQIFSKSGWNLKPKLYDLIIDNEIIPIIAVAIHSQGNRNNWYIPYQDTWVKNNWGPYIPKADFYANAIFTEVFPFLSNTYSVDLEETGIIGASLGGLISTWIGINFPEKIKYSASLSGSFWIADHQIFSEVDKNYTNEQKFWFDIGTAEWNYYVPLYSALDSAGVIPGERNFYYEAPDASHTLSDWKKRVQFPLKVFFGTTTTPEPESMEVVLECISSQSTPGLKFRRINPIVTLTSGVKYSLAHTALYSVKSGEAELGSEGSFRNNPETAVTISVQYQAFSEEVIVPKGWCMS